MSLFKQVIFVLDSEEMILHKNRPRHDYIRTYLCPQCHSRRDIAYLIALNEFSYKCLMKHFCEIAAGKQYIGQEPSLLTEYVKAWKKKLCRSDAHVGIYVNRSFGDAYLTGLVWLDEFYVGIVVGNAHSGGLPKNRRTCPVQQTEWLNERIH